MFYKSIINYRLEFFISLAFTMLATVLLEHSALDVAISQYFYQGNGQWWIAKDSRVPDWIFYTGIKRLLIIFELYIILAWLNRLFQQKKPCSNLAKNFAVFKPLQYFSQQELGYLAIVMLLIPTFVATLKSITQVPCPNDLQLFGGKLAYLSLWQDVISRSGQKCFPAAHASSGFALYAWAFLPNLRCQRWRIAIAVTVLAWLMGGYKMAIGDHFFSHTLVSMVLSWAICAGVGWAVSVKSSAFTSCCDTWFCKWFCLFLTTL